MTPAGFKPRDVETVHPPPAFVTRVIEAGIGPLGQATRAGAASAGNSHHLRFANSAKLGFIV